MTAASTTAYAPEQTVAAPARVRIRHLHAFRGFAIVSVVLIHAFHNQFAFAGLHPNADNGLYGAIVNTLFHDATLYFTLISGLLYSLLLRRRGWMAFYRSKILYVLIPYVVMTLAFTAYGLHEGGPLRFFPGDFEAYLKMAFWNFRNGGALYPYWYIVVLAMIFAVTPLLAALLSNARTRWIMWVLAFAPLVMSRILAEPTWTTPLYFIGSYAAGMLIGDRYNEAMKLVAKYKWLLIVTAIVSTGALLYLFVSGVDRTGIVSLRETAFYLQKMSLSLVILMLYRAAESRIPAWLETLATYSFTVYFLHAILLAVFEQNILGLSEPLHIPVMEQVIIALSSALFAIVGSVAIGIVARRLIGPRSRIIFGS
jgi:peptidoglycan/LPS O-acetylase OafA/YrhL